MGEAGLYGPLYFADQHVKRIEATTDVTVRPKPPFLPQQRDALHTFNPRSYGKRPGKCSAETGGNLLAATPIITATLRGQRTTPGGSDRNIMLPSKSTDSMPINPHELRYFHLRHVGPVPKQRQGFTLPAFRRDAIKFTLRILDPPSPIRGVILMHLGIRKTWHFRYNQHRPSTRSESGRHFAQFGNFDVRPPRFTLPRD